MTYYHIDYSQSSESPFGGPAKSAPFPGWGILPRAAGPSRIAIGASPDGLGAGTMTAMKMPAGTLKLSSLIKPASAPTDTTGGGVTSPEGEGWPWWIYLAVPLILGGGGLFAYDYFAGRKKATPNPRRRKTSTARNFGIGDRVQLHPGTDRWMMGDRFGTIEKHGRRRDMFYVRLDKSGKLLRFSEYNLMPVTRTGS